MEIKGVELGESKYIPRMIELCKRRQEHCMSELKAAGDAAYDVDGSGQIFAYPGGHFSRPVYNNLEDFVNTRQMNPLIIEQCLRQMFNENNRDAELFGFLTEVALVYAR